MLSALAWFKGRGAYLDDKQFQFEWDDEKARTNLRKHGVTFELAASIFFDPRLLELADVEHSSPGDERWFGIGLSENSAILVVIYQWMELDGKNVKVRLISARKATQNEIQSYWQVHE